MGKIIAFLTIRKELLFTSLVLLILCLFIGLSYYGYTNLEQKINVLYSLIDTSSENLLSLEEDEVTSQEIYVEIKGSVKNPGVYQMPKNSRVFELIEQAGGVTSLADTSNLNLSMLLEDAIALRIEQLCIERNMTKYALFEKSGVPQSTLTSIKKKRSRSVKIKTLYAICEGFGISLQEFFSSPLFDRRTLHD